MEQVLNQLHAMQQLDFQLQNLEELRGDLPQVVKNLKKELSETQITLENQKKMLETYQKERGMAEMSIKAMQDKQKRYQDQLYEVKTNREYDAVSMEIEAVKLELGKQEDRILELINAEETTSKEIEEGQASIERLESQFKEKEQELDNKLAETEKDEARLKNEKDKLVRQLNPRMVNTYERIRKAKSGSAVVPVIRGACGGCYKALPPQRILEIRQKKRLFLCEMCGRILVWDKNSAS